MPYTVLGNQNMQMNKVNEISILMEFIFQLQCYNVGYTLGSLT